MKHTPGPWTTQGSQINGPANIIIGIVYNDKNKPSKANAKLIATAPELLNVLEELNNAAISLADNAPERYKNQQNDLFADLHNAHLHAIDIIKKATE
jgi:hypothetical protein